MPSHNDLAVPQPATPAMNLGVNIREQIFISHRGDCATARLQSEPSETEIQKGCFSRMSRIQIRARSLRIYADDLS